MAAAAYPHYCVHCHHGYVDLVHGRCPMCGGLLRGREAVTLTEAVGRSMRSATGWSEMDRQAWGIKHVKRTAEQRSKRTHRRKEKRRRKKAREEQAAAAVTGTLPVRPSRSTRDIPQAVERQAVRDAHDEAPLPGDVLFVWLQDQPGHPLGPGMPLGAPLRLDGESHSNAWRRILRTDPCSYCGALVSGTVDHVEPKARRRHDTERWPNLTGACSRCNTRKATRPLLLFLLMQVTDGRALAS